MKFFSSLLSSSLLLGLAASVAIPDTTTANVNNLQARDGKKRMKIEDYGLERHDVKDFKVPDWFKDHGNDLKAFQIRPKGSGATVSDYAVSKDTYFVSFIKTEGVKDLKARDILIDSYLEANGGDKAKDLVYIGYDSIVHDQTRESIKKAWEKVKYEGILNKFKKYEDGGDFTIQPGKDGWDELVKDNPFIQGAESMVKEDEYEEILDEAKIDKVRVYVNPGAVKMHLYIRLKR